MNNIKLSLSELINITRGEIINHSADSVTGVSTDSRNISTGNLFIPIKGENFDGHRFIETAVNNGAAIVLSEKIPDGKLESTTVIKVENTLKAYQDIARFHKRKINPFTIAITGSSGKTSTKELTNAFVSKYFNTLKSAENFNNEIGVPQTLLGLKPEHQVAIIEMGMRGSGQIKELAEIAEPDLGIITNADAAHIELLKSEENIALAKWELADYLFNNNHKIIIPSYDKNLSSLASQVARKNIISINLEPDDISFLYMTESWIEQNKQFFEFVDTTNNKKSKVCLSLIGKHQISNALLALATARELKIEYPDFIDLSFEHLFGREEIININSVKIVNDSYNANPESMKASVEAFITANQENSKVLVLGEMRELGADSTHYHQETGKYISKFNIEQLIVIGKNASGLIDGYQSSGKTNCQFFTSNQEAIDYLSNFLNQEIAVLVKASRGAKLEEIIEGLLKSNKA